LRWSNGFDSGRDINEYDLGSIPVYAEGRDHLAVRRPDWAGHRADVEG